MLTVNDLLKACQEQVKKGNGNKTIYLAGDEEGNYFQEMCYLFTEDVVSNDWQDSIPNKNNSTMIILG